MRRQNLLPVLRHWKIWTALAAAVLLLVVSVAWMNGTMASNQARIDAVYEEMDVHFIIGPGRRTLSNGFNVSRYSLRTIVFKGYFENFGDGEVWTDGVFWAFDPEAAGIRVLEGELGDGAWVPESMGLSVGDTFTVSGTGSVFPVAAVIEGDKTYLSWVCFDELCKYSDTSWFYLTGMQFDLKKEYNRQITSIEKELQSLLNTPRPADRNRDVSISYNASEVDGMLRPLEKSLESAEFFGKLFRTVLPLVAYALEIIALIGLRNEIGVRRLLGDGTSAVFFSIWPSVLLMCLPGYACSAAMLSLTPLRPFVPWRMMLFHLAGTAVLTAVLTCLMCTVRPLDLLREKEDE